MSLSDWEPDPGSDVGDDGDVPDDPLLAGEDTEPSREPGLDEDREPDDAAE